jgi:putative membrane protein
MTLQIVLAYLHFISIIIAVGALAAELVLLRESMTLGAARMMGRVDALYGMSALGILVTGLLRVFHGGKGSAFYLSSPMFYGLLVGFALIALLSLPPTITFLRWRGAVRNARPPLMDSGTRRRLLTLMVLQALLLMLVMPLLAVLMARGY